jgi:alpha-tubulin suppressor-like RCC1 family protein
MRLHRAALGVLTAIAAIFPAALAACSDDPERIVYEDAGNEASTDAAATETGPTPEAGPRDVEVVDLPPPKIECAVAPCVVAIAAAERSTCALLSDSTVRCWGTNEYGQLGRGPIDADVDNAPAPVANLSKVTQLSSAANGYCARTEDGAVACWGDNQAGQLGPDDTGATFSDVPRTIAGLPKARAAFMGDEIACAALEAGDVMCWGRSSAGRIPSLHDAGESVVAPTKIDLGGRKIASIAPGRTAIVALSEDGTLLSWGRRSRPATEKVNMLGREVALDYAAPGPILYPEKAALLGGWGEAATASSGGGAFRWGMLIDLRGPVLPEPVPFATSAKAQWISIGPSAQFCAVLSDESIRCIGQNNYGQLGTGDFDAVQVIPAKVEGLPGAPARVATSLYHACAVLVTGATHCWGLNSRGQLGTGDFALRTTPTAVRFTP